MIYNRHKKQVTEPIFRARIHSLLLIILVGVLVSAVLGGCNGNVADGEVIAVVNGEEIKASEFRSVVEQEMLQYSMQGIDLESPEMAEFISELENYVLDSYFIAPILLAQEAEKAGITVSDEQYEQRYRDYINSFGSEEALLEQIEAMGMSLEELKFDISRELLVQNYLDYHLDQNLAQIVNAETIEIDQADIEAYYLELMGYYDELTALLEDENPDIPREQVEMFLGEIESYYGDLIAEGNVEELKRLLEEEIRDQEVYLKTEELTHQLIMNHIDELRAKGNIEIY